jgi:ATP sulfurylase
MELITPHGGQLVDRQLRGAALAGARERAADLPQIGLGARERSDLEMMATGVLSPLTGFMGEQDYRSVVREMRLASGLPWALPVTLTVSAEQAAGIALDSEVALTGEAGRVLGLMTVTEKYRYDKETEAQECFRTTETAHPGVRRLMAQGDVALAGPVWLLERPAPEFPEFHLDPADTRRAFAVHARGWSGIAASTIGTKACRTMGSGCDGGADYRETR